MSPPSRDAPPRFAPASVPAHEKSLKDVKLPDDAPPPPANEVSLEIGWNSDAPIGARYLRHVQATWVSFGIGIGALTVYGPKLSAIVRVQPDVTSGIFAQVSAGFTTGDSFTQTLTPPGSSQPVNVHFIRTPSRTIDPMIGWRLRWGQGSFVEAMAGYSFNLAGTVLQQGGSPVPVNTTKISFDRAGGGAAAISYGWLF